MTQPSLDKRKTAAFWQWIRNAAKHHLNPSSGAAENGTFGGPETAAPKEKKRAPVRRPKTWRNLAWTNAKRQPLGNGSETAKHHLNPSSGAAENGHSRGVKWHLWNP